MIKTLIRRLIILIPQLIVVSLLIFFLAEMMPGDALSGLFRDDPDMTQEMMDIIRREHGMYGPWYVRYTTWLGNMMQGEFGRSIVHNRPVTALIGERMGNTVLLSTVSVILVYAVALPLGIIAGKHRDKMPEKIISAYNFLQIAFPTVVFALVLQWVFAVLLMWLPHSGSIDVTIVSRGDFWEMTFSRLQHVMLPALSMSLLSGVGITQFLANEINDQKDMDYVTTARSKGVPIKDVYNRHIFRNSLLPIASNFGAIITGLFSGAIIIERIFSFNGMGSLFLSSIGAQDWPVVNFLVMFYGSLTVIGILISDIALTVFDPRIRIK